VCRLSELQRQLYEHFLLSNATRRLLAGSKVRVGGCGLTKKALSSSLTQTGQLCMHARVDACVCLCSGTDYGAGAYEGLV
jgi:hypothetical protein